MSDPIFLFAEWFGQAKAALGEELASAMCLGTATSQAAPSTRMVLLKHFDEKGFCFYTNFGSRKAHELLENPQASVCFYWPGLKRQVRIEGRVEKVSDKEADDYYHSRHPQSRIGAWASKQSQILESREVLVKAAEDKAKELEGKEIPRPPFWHGFRIVPRAIEFWQEGDYRLHQRRLFSVTNKGWEEQLLYP